MISEFFHISHVICAEARIIVCSECNELGTMELKGKKSRVYTRLIKYHNVSLLSGIRWERPALTFIFHILSDLWIL